MNNRDQLIELRQKLVLLCDEFVKLSDLEAWQLLIQEYPELDEIRRNTADSSENLWWEVRRRIPSQSEN